DRRLPYLLQPRQGGDGTRRGGTGRTGGARLDFPRSSFSMPQWHPGTARCDKEQFPAYSENRSFRRIVPPLFGPEATLLEHSAVLSARRGEARRDCYAQFRSPNQRQPPAGAFPELQRIPSFVRETALLRSIGRLRELDRIPIGPLQRRACLSMLP